MVFVQGCIAVFSQNHRDLRISSYALCAERFSGKGQCKSPHTHLPGSARAQRSVPGKLNDSEVGNLAVEYNK
jgi:hypothetical protein